MLTLWARGAAEPDTSEKRIILALFSHAKRFRNPSRQLLKVAST
jgi:hypothetical protein